MGCWNETCQISNLPIMAGEECLVFLVENVDISRKRPISSGLGSKYKVVCSPVCGEYDEYGGLDNLVDKYNVLPIFKEAAKCETEDFSDINAQLYDDEKYHLVWVKKDLFDNLKGKDFISNAVLYRLECCRWESMKELKVEDPDYTERRTNLLWDYVNIDKKFLWDLLSKTDNEEIIDIFALIEILFQLRKSLEPALESAQGDISEAFRVVSKYIIVNFDNMVE